MPFLGLLLVPFMVLKSFTSELPLRTPLVFNQTSTHQSLGIDPLDQFLLKSSWPTFDEKKLTFTDIIGGVPEAMHDLKAFIEDSEYFKRAGAKMPRGYIFYGPPGTGKTLLARALAGEVEAAFFAESAAGIIGKYVGDGVANVRRIFERAREALQPRWTPEGMKPSPYKHAIIFLDELDSVGRRTTDDSAAAMEMNRVINELLIQLDGFNTDENIYVIGATNRLELIDDALKRAGRFEYHIEITLPDFGKREAMLRHYASPIFGRRTHCNVDFADLAQKTEGFNAADIAALVNRAAIIIARQKRVIIDQAAFMKALSEFKK